jgi:hypothetical protein
MKYSSQASFLEWVDLRIENVPDDEIEARYGV